MQSFKWALDHGAWDSRAWTFRDALEAAASESKTQVNAAFVRQFYDRVAPGIYGEFDAPAMLPLIAPRPHTRHQRRFRSAHADGGRS